MTERSYWLGFSNYSGIVTGKFAKLLAEFGTAESAWKADVDLLTPIVGKTFIPRFEEFRQRFSIADYENLLKEKKVGYLTLIDKDYPKLLKEIKKPPFVLYYKGNKDLFYSSSEQSESRSSRQARTIYSTIAIVGTRRITDYGKQVTEKLTGDFVNNGF